LAAAVMGVPKPAVPRSGHAPPEAAPFSVSDRDFKSFLMRVSSCSEDDAYGVVALLQNHFLNVHGPASPAELAAADAADALGSGMRFMSADGLTPCPASPRLGTLFNLAKSQAEHAVRLLQAQELAALAPAGAAPTAISALAGSIAGDRKVIKASPCPPMSPYLTGRPGQFQTPATLLRWWQTKIDHLDVNSPDVAWPFYGPLLGDKPSGTPRLDSLSSKAADYKGTCVWGGSPHPPAHLTVLEPAFDTSGRGFFKDGLAFLATHKIMCEIIACCIKGGSAARPTPEEVLAASHGGDAQGLVENTPRFAAWPVVSVFHDIVAHIAVEHGFEAAEAYDLKVRNDLHTLICQSRGRQLAPDELPADDQRVITEHLAAVLRDVLKIVLLETRPQGPGPTDRRNRPAWPASGFSGGSGGSGGSSGGSRAPRFDYADQRSWRRVLLPQHEQGLHQGRLSVGPRGCPPQGDRQ